MSDPYCGSRVRWGVSVKRWIGTETEEAAMWRRSVAISMYSQLAHESFIL